MYRLPDEYLKRPTIDEFGQCKFEPATRDFDGHYWGTSLLRAKVRIDAKTTPPSLSYLLCMCPIQPGVRNLLIYS
jgi:hypothetical protein